MSRIVRLGDITKIYSGGTPSRSNPAYWGGDIPWVKTTQIQNCHITEDDIDEWITEDGLKHSSAKPVPSGSILMAMIGQGKTRGQVALLDIDATTNQNAAAIVLNDGYNINYVFQQLLFRYEHIRSISNASGQQNLNLDIIRSIAFPEPSLPEQKAIADLLATWDEAIEKTERLIQEKERRFKWLLSALLSGHMRSGKMSTWTETTLKEICAIEKGMQKNRDSLSANGAYPVVNGGVSPSGYTDTWNTDANTVTISEGGNSCGFVSFMETPFWCGGHCYALKNLDAKSMDPRFLFFYLKHHEKRIMRLRVGSGLPNIQRRDIEKFTVSYPPLEDQQHITSTLSSAQQEINLLKQLVEKYKIQKRGLMQKLLTGQWRVKCEKEVS